MQLFNLSGVDRQWNLAIDGRKSNSDLWDSINWKKVKQIVNRLQTRIVKAVKYCRVLYGALSMLEPCEVKVSRRVLRGGKQPKGCRPTRRSVYGDSANQSKVGCE